MARACDAFAARGVESITPTSQRIERVGRHARRVAHRDHRPHRRHHLDHVTRKGCTTARRQAQERTSEHVGLHLAAVSVRARDATADDLHAHARRVGNGDTAPRREPQHLTARAAKKGRANHQQKRRECTTTRGHTRGRENTESRRAAACPSRRLPRGNEAEEKTRGEERKRSHVEPRGIPCRVPARAFCEDPENKLFARVARTARWRISVAEGWRGGGEGGGEGWRLVDIPNHCMS